MPLRYVIQFTVIAFVSRWLQIFPRLTYAAVSRAAKRKPSSTIANVLAGMAAQKLDKEDESLHFWKLAYRENFDLGLLEFPGHSIEDYLKLLLKDGDLDRIRRAAQKYLRGHFDMRLVDPAPILSTLYKMAPNSYDQFLREFELENTPIFRNLTVSPIERFAKSVAETSLPSNFKFFDPHVFESTLTPVERSLTIPAQRVFQILDAEIIEGFQIVKGDHLLLYEEGGHPAQSWVAGLWQNFRHIEGQDPDVIFRLSHRMPVRLIDEAILISGRASSNYFHWLIEYIPRLLDTEAAGLAKSIPILIQRQLPQSMRDALAIINPGYEILEVDPSVQSLHVRSLWVPTFPTCVPDDFSLEFWQGARVSKKHMSFVRERVLSQLKLIPTTPKRRVFIGRRGGRGLENLAEIESRMRSRGLEIVFPERLSFAEQVELFHSAALIVAVSGAALTNVLFMQPGSQVIALTSKRNVGYAMNANVAMLFGVDFKYVAGPNVWPREKFSNEAEFVHSNFRVDPSQLLRALDKTKN